MARLRLGWIEGQNGIDTDADEDDRESHHDAIERPGDGLTELEIADDIPHALNAVIHTDRDEEDIHPDEDRLLQARCGMREIMAADWIVVHPDVVADREDHKCDTCDAL